MSESNHIRPIVICVFRNGNKILAGKHFDPGDQRTFYRPVGGGIEFGELSKDAVYREVKEEIGFEIKNPVLLGVLEFQFVFNNRPGHQIVFVYDAEPMDKSMYDLEEIEGVEGDGETFTCYWLDITKMGPDHPSVGPEGLLELLTKIND